MSGNFIEFSEEIRILRIVKQIVWGPDTRRKKYIQEEEKIHTRRKKYIQNKRRKKYNRTCLQ